MADKRDHTPAFWALVFVMFLGWASITFDGCQLASGVQYTPPNVEDMR